MGNAYSNEYKDSVVNLHIIKPILLTNLFSKCWLKHLGKIDGKKKIPVQNNNVWYSPTIDREQARLKWCMAVVSEKINTKNNELYISTEYMISKFEQAAMEYERLHNHLAKKISPDDIIIVDSSALDDDQKAMLKLKRKNEEPLDDTGIRIRRFNEYQTNFAQLRSQLTKSKLELEHLYRAIIGNLSEIERLDTFIETSFWKYSSKIEKRLSWYWQGVLLKNSTIKDAKRDYTACPPKPDNKEYVNFHENRRNELIIKVNEVKKTHEKMCKLEVV